MKKTFIRKMFHVKHFIIILTILELSCKIIYLNKFNKKSEKWEK